MKTGKDVYEAYAQLRDTRGLTDYRVAKDAHVSKTTLSDWKNGKREPTYQTLEKLARYFEVPVESFYEDGVVPEGADPASYDIPVAPSALSRKALHIAYIYDHADEFTQEIIERVATNRSNPRYPALAIAV